MNPADAMDKSGLQGVSTNEASCSPIIRLFMFLRVSLGCAGQFSRVGESPVTTETPTAAQPSVPTSEPDNSRSNRRDRNVASLTPMDQGTSTEDRRMTQQIRQAIVKNSSLSFNAKNVKVITINGKVTLRGPVNSDTERSTIDAAAKKIAGETQVENQLEIRK